MTFIVAGLWTLICKTGIVRDKSAYVDCHNSWWHNPTT